jgi:hypothetical protein
MPERGSGIVRLAPGGSGVCECHGRRAAGGGCAETKDRIAGWMVIDVGARWWGG